MYNSILKDATGRTTLDIAVSKLLLAAIHYELGDRSKAMGYLSKILEDKESGILRFLGKYFEGKILIKEGKINSGLSLFDDALELTDLEPLRKEILFDYQSVLYRFKKYKESNKIADAILEIKESREEVITVNFIKARNYIGMGDMENAEIMLRESKELITSSDRQLRNERFVKYLEAELHFAKGNYEAANRELFRLKPNAQLELKSRIQLALGEYEKALEFADKAQEMHFNIKYLRLPFSLYQKGQIYEKMGNATEAQKSYEALIELWKDGDKDNPILIDAIKRLNSLKRES